MSSTLRVTLVGGVIVPQAGGQFAGANEQVIFYKKPILCILDLRKPFTFSAA